MADAPGFQFQPGSTKSLSGLKEAADRLETGFNSSLVLLKVFEGFHLCQEPRVLFQFQPGSTKSFLKVNVSEVAVNLFQFQPGSTKRRPFCGGYIPCSSLVSIPAWFY